MADEIDPNAEVKPVDINATVGASKEYIGAKGEKVVVTEAELSPEQLKVNSIQRISTISELVELKAQPACQNCRFWNPTELRQNREGKAFAIDGQCRVNAPQTIVRVNSGYGWVESPFPLIGPYQWCGKYEAIPV